MAFKVKTMKVVFRENISNKLLKSLEWYGKEKSVIVLCNSSQHKNSLKLLPVSVIEPEEKDYEYRTAVAYKLKKKFVEDIVNRCVDEQLDIIFCHSHPPGIPTFSSIDVTAEKKFHSDIANQVKGIITASIVVSHNQQQVDSWFFDRKDSNLAYVDKIVIIEQSSVNVFTPAGNQTAYETPEYLKRTETVLGKENLQVLSSLDVCVVGCSSTGSIIIESLARNGIRSLTLIDEDEIEKSNLNRLQGATSKDIGKNKAKFYGRYAKKINPNVRVKSYQKTFYSDECQKALSQADFVFGCVDSEARMSINMNCIANLTPYIDVGVGVQDKVAKGQIIPVIPGKNICLSCIGCFDNLYEMFLPEEERKRKEKMGYGVNISNFPVNPLYDVNMMVTSIAMNTFMRLFSCSSKRQAELPSWINFNASKLSIEKYFHGLNTENECTVCSLTGFLGKGDKVPFLFPRTEEDGHSIPRAEVD